MAATQRTVLTVEQYLAEVLALVTPSAATEAVGLREASGRTLAEPVFARGDVPAFANSAMDGFAIRAEDADVLAEILDPDDELLRLTGSVNRTGDRFSAGTVEELRQVYGEWAVARD